MREKLILLNTKYKVNGADQTAHLNSRIIAFVIYSLENAMA